MKIPASIRSIYSDRKPLYERLKIEIDKRVLGWKNVRWHYESRVKAEESFALKIESGRFPNPELLEDFFAATIVAPNLNTVSEVEALLIQHFEVSVRRPNSYDKTHKRPDSFPFDDLRMYVSIKADDRYPDTGLEGIIFEFQIKTFLQHAWSIATHDLVYKGDNIAWSTERIAYQIKAMLEHAELSISEAESLSKSANLAKSTRDIDKINAIAKLMRQIWGDKLPEDTKRLAIVVDELCVALRISVEELEAHLKTYFAQIGGTPENLSPYLSIVECLLACETNKLKIFLSEKPSKYRSFRVLLTGEVKVPQDFVLKSMPRVIFLPIP